MLDKYVLEPPCGIHCGLCPLYKALTDEKLKKVLMERMNLTEEKATCTGCRAIGGYCPVIGEQCATWVCSKEKGVEFCYECTEFPCIKLMPCADRAEKIPHNMKVYSLMLRKMKGDAGWEKGIRELYDLYYRGKMVIGRGPKPKD